MSTAAVWIVIVMHVCAASHPHPHQRVYISLRQDLATLLHANDNALAPLMVRLAFHSGGTYSRTDRTGGSNGARIRFSPERDDIANRGLGPAIAQLEPLKVKYPRVSWADLITLAGATAIPVTGGPYINWHPGRTDLDDGATSPPNGRLPLPNVTAEQIHSAFTRMSFDEEETTALNGAHVLGKTHPNISRAAGPWTKCNRRFSNNFFRTALRNQYVEVHPAGLNKYYEAVDATHGNGEKLILLPSDKAMLESSRYNRHFIHFAHNQSAFYAVFARAYERLLEQGMHPCSAANEQCDDLPPTSCFELTRDARCLADHPSECD